MKIDLVEAERRNSFQSSSVLSAMIAAAILALALQKPEPVLWLNPNGTVLVAGQEVRSRLTEGASAVKTPYGLGLDVDGKSGGLLLGDLKPLALTGSMTVSTWVFLRNHPSYRAPLLFRGDDRNGNDPIELALQYEKVTFGVGKTDGPGTYAQAEIPLKQWVRITASYDAEARQLRMWINGLLKDERHTDLRPFAELDGSANPGVSMGNVQNDKGPHKQPLDGTIVDLRLYKGVLEPREAGWRPEGS